MKFFRLAWLGVLLLVGCVIKIDADSWSWDSAKVWIEEVRTFTVPASAIENLRVETHNGAISVAAASTQTNEIAYTVTIKAGGEDNADAQECLANIELVSRQEGAKHFLGWQWQQKQESGWSAVVEFNITQPADLNLQASTHNGAITVADIKGDCQVNSHNGQIQIHSESADLSAQTHNGRVVVESMASTVKIETHNGPIDATLKNPGALHGNISTHNGSIKLSLNDDASTKLVCATHNGSITTQRQLAEAVYKRGFLVGKLGNAEGTLEIETYNGSITVE